MIIVIILYFLFNLLKLVYLALPPKKSSFFTLKVPLLPLLFLQ